MGVCEFVDKLNRLRKSSHDSIDNIMKFDEFKKYIHVPRKVEEDLKNLLHRMKAVEHKKLILLCGSSGDGKSHLLSYLKNVDEEKLLEDYIIYNDATESDSPKRTAIQTLNELLDGFSDEKLKLPGKNIILAINLGLLNNFIETPHIWNRFKQLNLYVKKSNILSSNVSENKINVNSFFQHISFSDYHLYTLTEVGVKTDYIEAVFNKIFNKSDENIFYQAYKKKALECPLAIKCPVKNNFEYLQDKKNRRYVANLLIQAIIKNKMVLTTREILNYIYDIMVSSTFDYSKLYKTMTNETNFIREYVKNITPSLMFDNEDVSSLMDTLRVYDPLLIRNENADEFAITYNASKNVGNMIKEKLADSSYLNILGRNDIIEQSNTKLKSSIFNIMVRINWMKEYDKIEDEYSDYLKNLFYFNSGRIQKLSSLYSKVENAVLGWCGMGKDRSICLDDTHLGYAIYEHVKFEPSLQRLPKQLDSDEIIRFIPKIIIEFKNLNDSDNNISLDIDYSLYYLICKLNNGYIYTANDRNNYADFVSFVNKILKTGTANEKILIRGINNTEAILENTSFGYRFRVVK